MRQPRREHRIDSRTCKSTFGIEALGGLDDAALEERRIGD
jgi:hypothetical protein